VEERDAIVLPKKAAEKEEAMRIIEYAKTVNSVNDLF